MDERRTLAWHETLEMHELVAFQSNGLIKLKKMIREVKTLSSDSFIVYPFRLLSKI